MNIYQELSENQKESIKDKFPELIKIEDDEINKLFLLDFENVFKVENDILTYLSEFIEDYSKKKKEKDDDKVNNKVKKINLNNAYDILLIIYKEFIYLKNKKNSYISLNQNNIVDKIYFYLIINIINYKDAFIKGQNLLHFLYIKYYNEYKDFEKVIKEKEKIKKEIEIYTDEDLEREEKKEQNLENEDIEDAENEENTMHSYSFEIDKLLKNNLVKIIPEKYFKIYHDVLKKINNFYRIPFPINTLVNSDNIKFTFDIIDLISFHEQYTGNNEENKNEKMKKYKDNLKKYRDNLKKLELDIFNYYKNSTLDYVYLEKKEDKDEKLVGFKINEKMKNIFYSLKSHLKRELKRSLHFYYEYEIDYIPFGSITQFLSGENGDIDLFLDIKRKSKEKIDSDSLNRNKTQILEALNNILKKLDKDISFHQTNRLCLFTITYKNVKIDINVYGICSYFGEILLREYTLLDFRFPMLVVYLKYIISKKKIKNSEEQKIYINSFAWTNILLTFLQDILDPPVFPRLLNEENRRNITIKVGGAIGKDKRKALKDEFLTQNIRQFNVIKYPDNNLNEIKEKFYDIKGENKEKNKITKKNKMAVSEILLRFVQFIGYFFNYKYTIVNTSYECQSFISKVQINKLNDDNTKYFFKKCDEKEDLLLIREPFDYTYNPCKTVSKEKLDYIKKVFREIYINILENGTI